MQLIRYLAKRKNSNCVLIIAGEGPCRSELEAMVSQLNISESVRFLGYLRPARDAYVASDLFVLPSKYGESFPLVTIEAFMCEIPVLRSQGGGARAQIIPNETGEIFDPNREDEFASKLDRLLHNPRLTDMGRFARTYALSNFSQDKMCKSIEALYARTLRPFVRNKENFPPAYPACG